MKLPRAVLLPLWLLAARRLERATASDDHDARVDTLSWLQSINVTIHRPTAAVLEKVGAGSGPEDRLRVRATDRTAQPLLPRWDLFLKLEVTEPEKLPDKSGLSASVAQWNCSG